MNALFKSCDLLCCPASREDIIAYLREKHLKFKLKVQFLSSAHHFQTFGRSKSHCIDYSTLGTLCHCCLSLHREVFISKSTSVWIWINLLVPALFSEAMQDSPLVLDAFQMHKDTCSVWMIPSFPLHGRGTRGQVAEGSSTVYLLRELGSLADSDFLPQWTLEGPAPVLGSLLFMWET